MDEQLLWRALYVIARELFVKRTAAGSIEGRQLVETLRKTWQNTLVESD